MYERAIAEYGSVIWRLGRGYEADAERRRDLLQEMHLELWRSFALFDDRCALKTWVYRVAHNVASSHLARQRRAAARLVDMEGVDIEAFPADREAPADQQYDAQKLLGLIHQLRPADRQIILLYLEGETAAQVAEVTGLDGFAGCWEPGAGFGEGGGEALVFGEGAFGFSGGAAVFGAGRVAVGRGRGLGGQKQDCQPRRHRAPTGNSWEHVEGRAILFQERYA